MLNKKSVKILSIIVMTVMMLMTIGSSVFAAVTIPGANTPNTGNFDTTIGTILGIIQYGGIIAAVVIAMIIGIKYITSAPEGKAEVKKTATFYIAGIALLLSASVIVTIIGNTIKSGSINEGTVGPQQPVTYITLTK